MKLVLALLIITFSYSQSAEEIMKKSHLAYFYAEKDGKGDVVMKLVTSGSEKVKKFTMVRKDVEDGGDQKYFIYFKKPSDIKKMTFLIHKHIDKPDDRMLYIPAIDLVKKIAASDKASSFVGSDFSYEDISGRLWTEDIHKIVSEEKIGDSDVYKIESTPKSKDYFSKKISFISKENFLPLKEEFVDGSGNVFKRFTIEKLENIKGVPTAITRRMTNIDKDQYTEITFNNIQYNVGVKDKYFKERYLKKPHKSLK